VKLLTASQRQNLIALLEGKIQINKSYVQLRQKDTEVCRLICDMTGTKAEDLVNVDEILLELLKSPSTH